MTGLGMFLCGCRPEDKRGYSGDTIPSPIPGAEPIYTDKRFDGDGNEICPEHGAPLYGFITTATSYDHPALGSRHDFSRKGRGNKKSLTLNFDYPDFRDNRDPEPIGKAIQAERNGHN